jgi:nucleotide-binding universal stress UspA family protein
VERFRNILCVINPQTACQCTLERAVALAENNQADLTVVTVSERVMAATAMPEGSMLPAKLEVELADAETRELEKLLKPYRERREMASKVLTGTPFLEVIREVLRGGHDLLIKCPETPAWLNRFFASDDMHLLRKCPCPVWLIKPGSPKAYRRILAAVDVGDSYPADELETRQELNRLVMEFAGSLAVSEFAELHVAHAWDAVGESALRHGIFMSRPESEVTAYVEQVKQHHARLLAELMQQSATKLGDAAMGYLKPKEHLVKGSAQKEIPELAKRIDADLLVMGTVARTGVRGLIMGNTAETILEQIDCSVLAIKPPGFVTPVQL